MRTKTQISGNMELTRIKKIEDFLGLKEEWNQLLSLSANDSLFLRHEWLSAWWMSYGNQKELCILLVKHNRKLIAIAPLMIVKSKMRGIPLKRVAFMGDSDWTVNDFILSEQKKEAIGLIVDFLLKNNWDIADLRNLPGGSANIRIISDMLDIRGFFFSEKEATHSPFLSINREWEEFYNSRSIRFKKAIRNKINRINKSGMVTIRKYSKEDEVSEILPVIFDLGLKGWKHRQIKNAISSTEENRAFYSRLSNQLSKEGNLDIWLLRINETPVAFEYHVRYGKKNHGLIADFDEAYRDVSPGSILDFNIMQYIFKSLNGYEYDMGCGEASYKSNWTDQAILYKRVCIYNDTLFARLLMGVESKVIPYLKVIRDKVSEKVEAVRYQNKKKGEVV